MSCRAAVFNLLTTDTVLLDMGIDSAHVFPTRSVDNPPREPFVVLRWEDTSTTFGKFGPSEVLTVWAHSPVANGSSYLPLLDILTRVTAILTEAEEVTGADGVLVQIDFKGFSPDLDDDAYSTITKNAAFKVVSR